MTCVSGRREPLRGRARPHSQNHHPTTGRPRSTDTAHELHNLLSLPPRAAMLKSKIESPPPFRLSHRPCTASQMRHACTRAHCRTHTYTPTRRGLAARAWPVARPRPVPPSRTAGSGPAVIPLCLLAALAEAPRCSQWDWHAAPPEVPCYRYCCWRRRRLWVCRRSRQTRPSPRAVRAREVVEQQTLGHSLCIGRGGSRRGKKQSEESLQ